MGTFKLCPPIVFCFIILNVDFAIRLPATVGSQTHRYYDLALEGKIWHARMAVKQTETRLKFVNR